jgi:hypothetical protein
MKKWVWFLIAALVLALAMSQASLAPGEASAPCDDADGDGVCDAVDNCVYTPNPGQEDADWDGVGDACDNCVSTPNPGQEDSDGDGIGDACDILEIPADIKPGSCPNPFNVANKGVLSVAILGTDSLDVMQIDPVTVLLEGIAPLRWAWEDVATPFVPFIGKMGAYDCNECGPDGQMDITLKYKVQEVVAALGEVNDGDVLVLELTGNLREEFGGTPFIGEDVVLILKK